VALGRFVFVEDLRSGGQMQEKELNFMTGHEFFNLMAWFRRAAHNAWSTESKAFEVRGWMPRQREDVRCE
jgi:hypothetical protein